MILACYQLITATVPLYSRGKGGQGFTRMRQRFIIEMLKASATRVLGISFDKQIRDFLAHYGKVNGSTRL